MQASPWPKHEALPEQGAAFPGQASREDEPHSRSCPRPCLCRVVPASGRGRWPINQKETTTNIRISGQQIDLGAALQDHARARLDEIVSKYFERSIEASVMFKREGDDFRVDIVAHANARTNVGASAQSADIHRAFDEALVRIAKRLRRRKRRLVEHHADASRSAESWAV